MIFAYLKRGVIAGTVAGIAYGLYMAFVGNPLTEYLHDAGHDHGHGHSHGHGHEHTVTELTTAIVSAGSGLLWAILLGGVFGIALYLFEPTLPGTDAIKGYVLAGVGFLTVSVTPWLVLPPAAPGAEQLYTVETRLAIYTGLVVLGAITAIAAILAYERAGRRHLGLGLVAGAVPILAVVLLVPLVTPTVITHPDLSGELVSTYQALVALSQAGLWLLLAATFDGLRRWSEPIDTQAPTAVATDT